MLSGEQPPSAMTMLPSKMSDSDLSDIFFQWGTKPVDVYLCEINALQLSGTNSFGTAMKECLGHCGFINTFSSSYKKILNLLASAV